MSDQKCAVCNEREATDYTASGLGPASFSICRSCAKQGAEPLGYWLIFLDEHGVEAVDAPMREAARSWNAGTWIGWEDIVGLRAAQPDRG